MTAFILKLSADYFIYKQVKINKLSSLRLIVFDNNFSSIKKSFNFFENSKYIAVLGSVFHSTFCEIRIVSILMKIQSIKWH